jgi:hypothetical protein
MTFASESHFEIKHLPLTKPARKHLGQVSKKSPYWRISARSVWHVYGTGAWGERFQSLTTLVGLLRLLVVVNQHQSESSRDLLIGNCQTFDSARERERNVPN